MKSLFIGNLNFQTNEEELRSLFEIYGTVHSARVVTDRETGRSRGFAFLQMDPSEADAAIAALSGKEFNRRPLVVKEALPKEERRSVDRPAVTNRSVIPDSRFGPLRVRQYQW